MEKTLTHLMTKHQAVSDQVEANPWEVIPIKNSKQAKDTIQVHLGNRKATILTKFKDFPNLQIVWLNQNALKSLNGLQSNFRIKHLFVQKNKISSIDGIFDHLKYIETLVLYDNELRDLDRILKNLKGLTSMKHLDLFDNPAAHEPNYKFRVLNELQMLDILDRHKLSIVQKDEAVRFMSQAKGKKKQHRPFAW